MFFMKPATKAILEQSGAETPGPEAGVRGSTADGLVAAAAPSSSWHAAKSALFRYGISILAVGASVLLKLEFQRRDLPFPFTSFSLAAIALSFWYGGKGPGVLAAVATSVALACLFIPTNSNGLAIPASLANHVFLAVLVGWIVLSRRHAEDLLNQARSELESKVIARTASLRLANEELQAEIAERRRAEEALRASEQVARGQAEALIRSLDVLASAPEPCSFIGQMLGTMSGLLNAQSAIMWWLDEESDALVVRATVQGSDAAVAAPAIAASDHPLIKNPKLWKQDAIVQQVLSTGAPVVYEDLEHDPRVSDAMREYFRSKKARKCLAVPILFAGRVKGLISIRHGERSPYRPEEIELAQALTHQAMLAIQLTEFAEQRRNSAVLEERNRIARDIHDTLAQGFTGVIIQLEAAEDATSNSLMNEANEHLHRAADLARQSLSEARRSVRALRPQALENATFWDALKSNIRNRTVGTTIVTEFQLVGTPCELSEACQENLLRIGQEALTNTLKHARATQFKSRLSFGEQETRLELEDNGAGFEIHDRHDGFGLAGMHERVAQMGGKITVTSTPGAGTKILVVLPVT